MANFDAKRVHMLATTTDTYRVPLEEPEPGTFAERGTSAVVKTLHSWWAGARPEDDSALEKAISWIEAAEEARESHGDPPILSVSQRREALAIAYWLTGDRNRARETFRTAAEAGMQYLAECSPNERRTYVGQVLLHWLAAGEPAEGLRAVEALAVPLPREGAPEPRDAAGNSFSDSQAKAAKTCAGHLIAGKKRRDVSAAMKRFLTSNMDAKWLGAGNPINPAIWMYLIYGMLSSVSDAELALSFGYRYMPKVSPLGRMKGLVERGEKLLP